MCSVTTSPPQSPPLLDAPAMGQLIETAALQVAADGAWAVAITVIEEFARAGVPFSMEGRRVLDALQRG